MKKTNGKQSAALAKAPTGIQGLDELTGGGLPRGRTLLRQPVIRNRQEP